MTHKLFLGTFIYLISYDFLKVLTSHLLVFKGRPRCLDEEDHFNLACTWFYIP